MNKQTKGILGWFKNLKTSWKITMILGVLFVIITGTAMCATCGNSDKPVSSETGEEI